MTQYYQGVIITASITVVARLLRQSEDFKGQIVIVDPTSSHYYQPFWTSVGAGASKLESTRRSMKQVLPNGMDWIKQAVQQFNPEENHIN